MRDDADDPPYCCRPPNQWREVPAERQATPPGNTSAIRGLLQWLLDTYDFEAETVKRIERAMKDR